MPPEPPKNPAPEQMGPNEPKLPAATPGNYTITSTFPVILKDKDGKDVLTFGAADSTQELIVLVDDKGKISAWGTLNSFPLRWV